MGDPATLVDLALAALLLECVVLLAWRPAAARGLLPTLAAGGGVLVAWRIALAGFGWPWIGGALAAALVFHLLDLHGRLRPPR